MLSVVKMSLKREVGSHALVMEITLLIMEKSWNCVFKFLWEPCYGDKGIMHQDRQDLIGGFSLCILQDRA